MIKLTTSKIILFVAILIAIIAQNSAPTITWLIGGLILSAAAIAGVYYLIKNFKHGTTTSKALKIAGIVLLTLLFFIVSVLPQIDTIATECHDVAAKNMFTGKTFATCYYGTSAGKWYNQVLTGEEARPLLFDYCMSKVKADADWLCDRYSSSNYRDGSGLPGID